MSNSDSSFASLISNANTGGKKLPPVELWDPPYCGEIDIEIMSNGVWLHNKTPIERKKLFKLFSTVLLRQDDEFFLVTPVEKLKIQVQWQPFAIVDFEIIKNDKGCNYRFIDNCDNQIMLTKSKQLQFSKFEQQFLPIVNVRRNLWASFSRSCYYRLIEQATISTIGNQQEVQISSAGSTFCIGRVDE